MMKKDVDIGPIMAMMRNAYRLVKIAPFAYSVIYIVGIGIYAFCGEDMSDFIKVMLSVLMAYLSYWFGIVLVLFNRLYDEIWRRLTK